MDKINQSGQALVEYILLIAIVIGVYSAVLNTLGKSSGFELMKKPFTREYRYTYQYGNAKARGQDNGGPTYLPQHHDPQNNFRIFINPPSN